MLIYISLDRTHSEVRKAFRLPLAPTISESRLSLAQTKLSHLVCGGSMPCSPPTYIPASAKVPKIVPIAHSAYFQGNRVYSTGKVAFYQALPEDVLSSSSIATITTSSCCSKCRESSPHAAIKPIHNLYKAKQSARPVGEWLFTQRPSVC